MTPYVPPKIATKLQLLPLYRRTFRTYLKVLVGLLTVVLLFSFIQPQTWRAATTIMPPESGSGGGGLASLLSAAPISLSMGGADSKAALTFVEILRSRTIRERVTDSLKLAANPLYSGMTRHDIVEELGKDVYVEISKSAKVTVEVDVQTRWFDPFASNGQQAAELSAQIANAYRQTLDKLNQEKSVSQARSARHYIERVLEVTKAEIDSIQDSLEVFQHENNVLALDEQLGAIASNVGRVGGELAQARIEYTLFQQEFNASAPILQALQRKIATLESQYRQIQDGGLVSADGLSVPVSKMPALMRSYLDLTSEIKVKSQLAVFLESQRMQELVQEAKDVPTVVVLDSALPPKRKIAPSRPLMLGLAFVVLTAMYIVITPSLEVYRKRGQFLAAVDESAPTA
jgi:tyrosine-protein kinase Etk/Wzc